MEIGGYDTRYATGDPEGLMRGILAAVGWADPVTEKLDHCELFVYPDQAAKDAWDRDAGPDGSMIYFIVDRGSLSVCTDEGLTGKIRRAFPPES